MRALLVVNPTATATTPQVREVLAAALGEQVKLDVAPTTARGHAVSLARQAVDDGLDLVVALGGDGTVNEVVNGLLSGGPRAGLPALGVVPAGNANVFARALGLPRSPVEATAVLLEALRHERRRAVGLGRADERWFTFSAGLGLDAQVVRRVERRRAVGRRATPDLFVRQAVRQVLTGRRQVPTVHVETHDGRREAVRLALVCNTTPWTYLGPRPVVACPRAGFDTGLDLFAMRTLRTTALLRQLRQLLSDRPRPGGRTVVSLHDQAGFTLRAEQAVALQVDGDDLGDRTRVAFRSYPRALSVAA